MIIIEKNAQNFVFSKKMPIFVLKKKPIKITIMKQNYRITIFTATEIIEKDFYKKEIAIDTIVEFKKRFDDFIIGILSEKIKGEWHCIANL